MFMARKRKRKNKQSAWFRSYRLWLGFTAFSLLIFQSLWLAAFISSTHTVVPSNVKRWISGDPQQAWDEVLEEELDRTEAEADNLRLQKLLAEKGSRGLSGEETPEPAVP
jgi:hypothetical protein